jgi:hypothetical protein
MERNRLLPLLPQDCTLPSKTALQQVAHWRTLKPAYLRANRQPDSLTIAFGKDDAVSIELQALVAIERDCCSFLTWTIVEADGELHLTVHGDPDELDRISALIHP